MIRSSLRALGPCGAGPRSRVGLGVKTEDETDLIVSGQR